MPSPTKYRDRDTEKELLMPSPTKYRDRDTERFAEGNHVRRLAGVPGGRANVALDRLEQATGLIDLRSPPGNRFEKLKGNREGQYSIRINDQWRVCFEWPEGTPEPLNIEIVDYHEWTVILRDSFSISVRNNNEKRKDTLDQRRRRRAWYNDVPATQKDSTP